MRIVSIPFSCVRVACVGALLGLTAAGAPKPPAAPLPEQAPLLEIDVRSMSDQPLGKLSFKRQPKVEHGKVYAIVEIKNSGGVRDLVRPVNEHGMLVALHKELRQRGFRLMAPDQKPDIVLTVMYGRGLLRNPYLADATVNEIMSDPPIVTILGAWPTQIMKEHEPFFEGKLQKANSEKLFIRVTAWKFPEQTKEKPKTLWKTTILVDDPENRDLNLIFEKMLAAGSPYFDRTIDSEQVEVTTHVREGRVDIGTPTVVEPVGKKP